MKKALFVFAAVFVVSMFSGCISDLANLAASNTKGRIIINGLPIEPPYITSTKGGIVTINEIVCHDVSKHKSGAKLADMYVKNIEDIVVTQGRLAIIYSKGKRMGNVKNEELKVFYDLMDAFKSGKSTEEIKQKVLEITRDAYLTDLLIKANR